MIRLYILILLLIIIKNYEVYSFQNTSSFEGNNVCLSSCFTAKEICIGLGNELIQRATLGFVRNAADESCSSMFDKCKSLC